MVERDDMIEYLGFACYAFIAGIFVGALIILVVAVK